MPPVLATKPNAAIPTGARKKKIGKDKIVGKTALTPDPYRRKFEEKGGKALNGMNDTDVEKKSYLAGKPYAGDKGLALDVLAFDRESVRSFDSDGRLRVAVANLSKEQIRPYKGKEIPGWDAEKGEHLLGLEPDKVYQMFCSGEELAKAAKSANEIQVLRKHIPVDAEDHRRTDIVGTTGSNAVYNAPYLQNSLSIWSKEGIDLIESGKQQELSCGYHYTAIMTPGKFGANAFDGFMTDIEFNHVALVEEGRAGPDVLVGDSALQTEKIMRPTRLEYLAVTRANRGIAPLLAFDAKVELGPVFKGLNTSNLKSRRKSIIGDLKTLLKGKTIAKDASIEHLAKMLDSFEHVEEPKSLDESVSEEQHKAMEAAAHGESNLGIPKKVGEEFVEKDRKSFGDMLNDWMTGRDAAKPFGEDDVEALKKLHEDAMPESALDESEEEEEEAEDEFGEEGEADDESESEEEKKKKMEAKDKAAKDAKDKAAKDKAARDKKDKTMDSKRFVTVDAMQDAIKSTGAAIRKDMIAANEARAMVRPYVGEVSIALDSAEGIYRAAAKAMGVEGSDKMHIDALPTVIKTIGEGKKSAESRGLGLATDSKLVGDGTMDRWGDVAGRIGHA